jgi:uncharacterized membrane protein YbhN (UPF0104 family)
VKRLTPTAKRRLILLTKWLIALTVAIFIVRSFSSARRALAQDPTFSLRAMNPGWLCLAGLFYFVGLLPMGLYWHYLVSRLGQRPRVVHTLRAYFMGHLGKYVPGKAIAVVLRTAFMRGDRVNGTVVAVSVFIETFTMMSVGAALATALIAWQFSEHVYLLLLGCLLMVFAGIPTWPPFVRWSVKRLKITGWSEDLEASLRGYTWRVMLVGWVTELAGWSIIGFSLWAVLRSLPLETPLAGPLELWPRLTASVSLSMVAGFLSLLPAGLGVREVVLDQLLKQPFGQLVAPLSAVLLRSVWMLTELLASGILYVGLRHREPVAPRPAEKSSVG